MKAKQLVSIAIWFTLVALFYRAQGAATPSRLNQTTEEIQPQRPQAPSLEETLHYINDKLASYDRCPTFPNKPKITVAANKLTYFYHYSTPIVDMTRGGHRKCEVQGQFQITVDIAVLDASRIRTIKGPGTFDLIMIILCKSQCFITSPVENTRGEYATQTRSVNEFTILLTMTANPHDSKIQRLENTIAHLINSVQGSLGQSPAREDEEGKDPFAEPVE